MSPLHSRDEMSSIHLEKQVVLITGCSEGGVGYELCKAFDRKSCIVYGTARNVNTMGGLGEHGIRKLHLDVNDNESIRQAVATVIQEQGRLDILVNNAAICPSSPVAEMDPAGVRGVFDTNLFGLLAMTQEVLPIMTRQRRGKVVNIGSTNGYVSLPWFSAYSASKAAVQSLSDAMRLELKPLGIQVMLVVAGAVKSNMRRRMQQSPPFRPDGCYTQVDKALHVKGGLLDEYEKIATPTHLFARQVVEAALRRQIPRHFLCGTQSWLIGFVKNFPLWFKDSLLLMLFKPLGSAHLPINEKQ